MRAALEAGFSNTCLTTETVRDARACISDKIRAKRDAMRAAMNAAEKKDSWRKASQRLNRRVGEVTNVLDAAVLRLQATERAAGTALDEDRAAIDAGETADVEKDEIEPPIEEGLSMADLVAEVGSIEAHYRDTADLETDGDVSAKEAASGTTNVGEPDAPADRVSGSGSVP